MTDNARNQAKAQLESIRQMIAKACSNSLPDEEIEAAEQEIFNDPLSVAVRSAWVEVGQPMEPDEFMILLCTGGPAVRILGTLYNNQPWGAPYLQYQDWGTPWTTYPLSEDESGVLRQYCNYFFPC